MKGDTEGKRSRCDSGERERGEPYVFDEERVEQERRATEGGF